MPLRRQRGQRPRRPNKPLATTLSCEAVFSVLLSPNLSLKGIHRISSRPNRAGVFVPGDRPRSLLRKQSLSSTFANFDSKKTMIYWAFLRNGRLLEYPRIRRSVAKSPKRSIFLGFFKIQLPENGKSRAKVARLTSEVARMMKVSLSRGLNKPDAFAAGGRDWQ